MLVDNHLPEIPLQSLLSFNSCQPLLHEKRPLPQAASLFFFLFRKNKVGNWQHRNFNWIAAPAGGSLKIKSATSDVRFVVLIKIKLATG